MRLRFEALIFMGVGGGGLLSEFYGILSNGKYVPITM